RCAAATEACKVAPPPLVEVESGHYSACIRATELAEKGPQAIGLSKPAGPAKLEVPRSESPPLLRLERLTKHFVVSSGSRLFGRSSAIVRAVNDVSFSIAPGQTLGLVGESGCGKTTVGRLVLKLEEPTSGSIFFEGKDLTKAGHDVM